MTYRKDEALGTEEQAVLKAVAYLNSARRSTNNSQISNESGLSRQRVSMLAGRLSARGYIRNTGRGAAWNWRLTDKGKRCEPEQTRQEQ